jgi:hypothetical protein
MVVGAISGSSAFVAGQWSIALIRRPAAMVSRPIVLAVDGAGVARPIEEVGEPSDSPVVGLGQQGQVGHGAVPFW